MKRKSDYNATIPFFVIFIFYFKYYDEKEVKTRFKTAKNSSKKEFSIKRYEYFKF